MNARLRLTLALLAAGLLLVSVYVRTGGAGISSVIPWAILPPLVAYVGVEIARNALRQMGPPTLGTVFHVFAFWTVIVLAYQIALRSEDDVRVGEFVARVFIVSLCVTLPYALAGLARRLFARESTASATPRHPIA
jgi:hypothetical protein